MFIYAKTSSVDWRLRVKERFAEIAKLRNLFFFFLVFKFFFFFFRFFGISWLFWTFFGSLDFLKFSGFLGDFFFWIPFKITKVTTKSYQGYYWTPKIAKNGPKPHNKFFFCPKGKKASDEGRSPLQELEVGPRSGPYFLVSIKYNGTFARSIMKPLAVHYFHLICVVEDSQSMPSLGSPLAEYPGINWCPAH